MLRNILLATVATVALGGTALAADLPIVRQSEAVIAPPLFSWTGFYVGVHAGGSFAGDNGVGVGSLGGGTPPVGVVGPAFPPGSVGLDSDGFIGGAQVGYNWQMGSIVFGAEADISYADVGETVTVLTGPAAAPFANTFRHDLDYLGTVRARLGFAADRFLVYATGGLAYGDVKVGATFTGPGGGPVLFTGGRSDTQVGWTIGGGVEYAFTNNVTVRAEYLYYDLGDTNVFVAPTGGGLGNGYNANFETNGHIIRAGLNYKF